MKLAVCLHGGAVARTAMPLHPGDRALVSLGRRLGLEPIAVELLAAGGVAPRAVNEAAAEGLVRAVRVVDEALAMADAPATGLVAERVLRELKADLITFVAAADPEGAADVPAVLAFRLGAAYVPGAFELAATATAGEGPPSFTARAWRGAVEVTLALPRGAVVEIDPARAPASVGTAAAASGGAAAEAPSQPGASVKAAPIRVVTLADLALDATLVRRRDDLRGVVEPTARPLVTTRSSTSLAALLR